MKMTRKEFYNFREQLFYPNRECLFDRIYLGRIRRGGHSNFRRREYLRFPSFKYEQHLVKKYNTVAKRLGFRHKTIHSFDHPYHRLMEKGKNYIGCVAEKTIDEIIEIIKTRR